VLFAHPAFEEWYTNGPAGIEQGFELRARPQGAGPLRIVGEVASDLTPRRLADGIALRDHSGIARLVVRKIRAWDSTRRPLPARLVIDRGARLALEVDDAGARYPVYVDPTASSPA